MRRIRGSESLTEEESEEENWSHVGFSHFRSNVRDMSSKHSVRPGQPARKLFLVFFNSFQLFHISPIQVQRNVDSSIVLKLWHSKNMLAKISGIHMLLVHVAVNRKRPEKTGWIVWGYAHHCFLIPTNLYSVSLLSCAYLWHVQWAEGSQVCFLPMTLTEYTAPNSAIEALRCLTWI